MSDALSLDLDDVSAFLSTADLKSFTRAADALGTTQSAISLRIKRLEDRLGRRLLDRTPRSVKISADGAVFLEGARALLVAHGRALASFAEPTRRLRLGISDHLAGSDLPLLLKGLTGADPFLSIGLDIAPSSVVLETYDDGAIDAALVLRHETGRRDGLVIGSETFVWAGALDFRDERPVRIATHSRACAMRALAMRALDDAGIAWTEAFTGGGLDAVAGAVSAGLAIAAMARRTAPAGSIDVTARFGLPPLPRLDVVLHSRATDARTRAALRTLGAIFRQAGG